MNELRKVSKLYNLRSQTDQYVIMKVDDVLIIDLVLVVVCLALKKLNLIVPVFLFQLDSQHQSQHRDPSLQLAKVFPRYLEGFHPSETLFINTSLSR